MSSAKVTEISASSPESFHDAIVRGIARASRTLRGINGAWVNEERVLVDEDGTRTWRVSLKLSFTLDD